MKALAVCVASASMGSLLVVLREIAPTIDATSLMVAIPFVLGAVYIIAVSKAIKWLA